MFSLLTLTSALFMMGCEEPEVVQITRRSLVLGTPLQAADKVSLDGRIVRQRWRYPCVSLDVRSPATITLNELTFHSVNHTEDGTTTFQPDVGTYIVKLSERWELVFRCLLRCCECHGSENAPVANAGADITLEVGALLH